jgi:hypothetical protein
MCFFIRIKKIKSKLAPKSFYILYFVKICMERKEWSILSIASFIMAMVFIAIDLINGKCLNTLLATEIPGQSVANFADVWCVVNSEIYEPFIYLFGMLWVVFSILEKISKK